MPEPSPRSIVSAKGWVMPGIPALPRNSAHTDHRNAAEVPTETRVSMVAAPCRALVRAARWKGQAAYVTTGAVSVSDSHCQYVNCQAGTMASTTTGSARTTEVIRRRRSGPSSSSAGSVPSAAGAPAPAGGVTGRAGAGGAAV